MGDTAVSYSSTLVFYVNGQKIVCDTVNPHESLISYLRYTLKLTGSKVGCNEGGCGACTVMVSYCDRHVSPPEIKHMTVNACLTPLASMHGKAVTTVEGIGSTRTKLHAVQERLVKSHGSQCGFCTPGMVMSMYALLRNMEKPTYAEVEMALQGNLCRCTGYRPILDGFKTLASCCRGSGKDKGPCCRAEKEKGVKKQKLSDESAFAHYDPSQELIFPPELQLNDVLDNQLLKFTNANVTWFRPRELKQLSSLKKQYPEAKLVAGSTIATLQLRAQNNPSATLISLLNVQDFHNFDVGKDGVRFGACCSIASIKKKCASLLDQLPVEKSKIFSGMLEMFRWFANPQVRNVGTIGGSLGGSLTTDRSHVSDLTTLLMAVRATVCIADAQTEAQREWSMRNGIIDMKSTDIILSVFIPYTDGNDHFEFYKQCRRRNDDVAIVNAAMLVSFTPNSNQIHDISMAYGGLKDKSSLAVETTKAVKGKEWSESTFKFAGDKLVEEFALPLGSSGGMEEYRKTLMLSLFFKFYLTVKLRFGFVGDGKVPNASVKATEKYKRLVSSGSQLYQEELGEAGDSNIGKPMVHLSATQQSTGEAKYVDDMPKYEDELYLALVTSSKAHAKLVSVDASAALDMPDVVAYIDHRDIPGENGFGEIVRDDTVFVTDKVTCHGHSIGAVIAKSRQAARKAVKLVRVEYEELPAVVTIEQAIEANEFFSFSRSIKKGNLEEGFTASDHVIEGEVRTGGQEHFYLEPCAILVVPKGEDGEIEIFASTQSLNKVRIFSASVLGVPENRILARTKRVGGGFGGKETRNHTMGLAAVVAAYKLNKPIRCVLDRDDDMLICAGRHPMLGKYKVGFTNEGKILALDISFYANAGNTLDLSPAVIERALLHATNCYYVPNVDAKGYECKTNLPSNTAFRGLGAPQATLICEHWMNEVATVLDISPEQLRELNLFQRGDITHFNQALEECTLQRCWDQCLAQSEYNQRRRAVDMFNSENRWLKRGVAVVPVMFGLCFGLKALHQGACLLHVYTDGSVLLAHGGVEIGQGLYTKMVQVAARALGIPTSLIHTSETSSHTVPNTTATVASMSSDLNGFAVINACNTILERLEPYKKQNPQGSWADWIKAAYFDRTSLSTTGFYKTPDIGYDYETNTGRACNYFTYGVACSEVEIDCLTGGHTLLSTNIVMDLGRSINPAIDIGQIEGAFTQGYGLFTLEELQYSPDGLLLTRGPSSYKIPTVTDIPVEFNVSLLKGSGTPRAVYSSKAVGEPPLLLGVSPFFAIKDAINSARCDAGLTGAFLFNAPATAERIRMACVDDFTKRFQPGKDGSFKPYSIIV